MAKHRPMIPSPINFAKRKARILYITTETKPLSSGVLVSFRACIALVSVWLTASGAMERDRSARDFPVSKVASQGKDLAPKTIRTSGIRRTKISTHAGKAKKNI